MGNDLSMAFPFVIFITLVCILAGFFIINEDDMYLREEPHAEVPFTPQLHGDDYNVTSGEYEETEESTNWWGVLGGIATIFAGAGLFVFTGGTSTGLVLSGLTMLGGSFVFASSIPGGTEFLEGLPVVGSIMSGLSYVGTALGSFWSLMTFQIPVLGGLPIFAVIFGVPIVFFFFVFIIRFIRGQ